MYENPFLINKNLRPHPSGSYNVCPFIFGLKTKSEIDSPMGDEKRNPGRLGKTRSAIKKRANQTGNPAKTVIS